MGRLNSPPPFLLQIDRSRCRYGGIDTRDRRNRSDGGPRGGDMKEEERKMRQAEAKEAWRNEEVRYGGAYYL